MKIWLWITGFLGIAAVYFKDRLQVAKIKELQRDSKEAKATLDAFNKADEALARGIADENNTDTDNHDFNR